MNIALSLNRGACTLSTTVPALWLSNPFAALQAYRSEFVLTIDGTVWIVKPRPLGQGIGEPEPTWQVDADVYPRGRARRPRRAPSYAKS